MGLRLPEQLPPLSGWVLIAYRFGLPILLALGLFSTLYLIPSRLAHDNHANRILMASGLKPQGFEASGQKVSPFSPEARAAGIGVGVFLIGIDGRPAPTDFDGVVARLDGPDGAPVAITVRSRAGAERTVTLHRDKVHLDAVYSRVGLTYEGSVVGRLVIDTVGSLLALLVATLLYLRRKRDPVAALIAIGVTLVSINFLAMTTGLMSLGAQDVLLRFPAAAAFLSVGVGLSLFPSSRFSPRSTWASIGMWFVVTVLYQLAWNGGPWLLPYSVSGAIALITLGVVIVQRYRAEPDGVAKQQMKFGMLGIAFFAFFDILSIVIGIEAGSNPDEGIAAWALLVTKTLGSMGWISLQLGLLVSLLRFRLYDAETAISRSAVVGALTLFLGFIFAASEKLLENAGESYLGPQSQGTAAAVSAVIAATLIAPIHHRLSKWAERRFQKNLIALREDLPRLAGDLRETASPERLAAIVLDRVERGVRSSRGAILLGNRVLAVHDVKKPAVAAWRKAHPLDPDVRGVIRKGDDRLFPVRVPLEADGCGHVGWLLLGPRPDGTLFGKDESEVLAALADPLARALTIAAARSADAAKREEEVNALRRLISGEVVALRQLFSAHDKRLNRLDPDPL